MLRTSHFTILLALAAFAVLVVLLATRFGIGVTPDSTIYIDAARRLLQGEGLTALSPSGEFKPLTHYPPLYSCLLAAGGLVAGSIEVAARFLNAILFGANVFLVGFVLKRHAPASFWLPVLGSAFTLTATDILSIHTFALSEPLFLFLGLGALECLTNYLSGNRKSLLVLSAVLTALALLTRYAGVALVFSGVVVLLLLNPRAWRKRLLDVLVYGAIACVPAALWSLRNMRSGGGATGRSLLFHPLDMRQLLSAVSTFSSWLLLGRIRFDYRIGFFAAEVLFLAAVVIFLIKKRRTLGPIDSEQRLRLDKLPHVLAIFITAYICLLVFTASFVDADMVLDARALVPVHLVTIVLVLSLAMKLLAPLTSAAVFRGAIFCLVVLFLGSYSVRAVKWFVQTRSDGQVYRSRAWQQSETISKVRQLPPGTAIYSNGYDAVYYLTGRPAIYVPEKVVHGTGRENRDYDEEVTQMRKVLETRGGVLVYFNTLPERWFLPSERELVDELNLQPLDRTTDGALYSSSPQYQTR